MEKETLNRMLEEYKALSEKIDHLRAFILDEEKFNAVDTLNRDMLITQLKAMETYQCALSVRIGLNANAAESEIPETGADIEDTGITE